MKLPLQRVWTAQRVSPQQQRDTRRALSPSTAVCSSCDSSFASSPLNSIHSLNRADEKYTGQFDPHSTRVGPKHATHHSNHGRASSIDSACRCKFLLEVRSRRVDSRDHRTCSPLAAPHAASTDESHKCRCASVQVDDSIAVAARIMRADYSLTAACN